MSRLRPACATAIAIAVSIPAAAQQPSVDELVRAMTLQEKVTLLHGARDPSGKAGAGYVPGIPRLGIPPIRMADGPAGIRTRLPATALPAPVMLAATFDTALARRFGEVIGREGRAREQDVLLSPMVNIVRVPHAGRNFETLGEDPLLAARMVAAEVRGIESQGLIATVKHYVANNFEQDRTNVDAVVSERALREIYLPGFEAAVAAGVGAVMCAYNKVNGTHACEHKALLTDYLRNQFGFEGWVMTDWFARHSLGALEAGLDQEMPGLSFGPQQPVYFGDSLIAAVEGGRVPEAAVDRAVRRILTQMDRMSLLGEAPARPEIDPDAGARAALDMALAGAVLLRNERRTLPLTNEDVTSLAVIGPTGGRLLYGGGGSSHVTPFRTESPFEALLGRAGSGARLHYAAGIDLDGVPVPTSALAPAGQAGGAGLLRSSGDATQVDGQIDFTGAGALPSDIPLTWTGTLTAPVSGVYELKLQTRGGNGTLSLDGQRVLTSGGFFSASSLIPTADSLSNATVTLTLEAGTPHAVEVSLGRGGQGLMGGSAGRPREIRLAWVTPERRQAFLDTAVATARAARAAVVFVYDEGTEGRDRSSLALPNGHDSLVAAVAAANARTTVVVNSGDPVLMPWVNATGAVLQMWYPGQEGADATAALLLGQANPGGKLPVTFPQSEVQTPVGSSEERYPGRDGKATYDEDFLVGYRWYDAHDATPLFGFGHGLSYTTFAYSDLTITPVGDGYDLSFRVRNTGAMRGAEVAQAYVSAPTPSPVPMAPRGLVGFARIVIDPGAERTVTMRVDPRSLAYWSPDERRWVVAAGARPVWVGSASSDIRLRGELNVPPEEHH